MTDEEEEGNDNKEEKITTATKKGSAVLDQWLPDDIKTQYHVLQIVSLYIHSILYLVKYLCLVKHN